MRRFVVLFASSSIALGAHAQWTFDFDAARIRDSNLPLAQRARDILSDQSTTISGTASRSFYLDDRSDLRAGVFGRATGYQRFDGVSNTEFGATLAWRRKFGLGLTAPWLEAAASAARRSYRQPLRDRDRSLATLSAGRRFNEFIDGSIGFQFDRSRALHDLPVDEGVSGRVFDLHGRSLFAGAGIAVTQRVLVTLELSARRGGVVSSSTENPAIDAFATAAALDPAFGPGYEAYRLSGTTTAKSINGSFSIDDRSSMNLSVSSDHTRSGGGIEYRATRIDLRYLIRY